MARERSARPRHLRRSLGDDHRQHLLSDDIDVSGDDNTVYPPSTGIDSASMASSRRRLRSHSAGSIDPEPRHTRTHSHSRSTRAHSSASPSTKQKNEANTASMPMRDIRLERTRSDLGEIPGDTSDSDSAESVKSAHSVRSTRSAGSSASRHSSSSHTLTPGSLRRRMSDPDFQLAARMQQLKQQQSFVTDGTVKHVLELEGMGAPMKRSDSISSLRSVRSLTMDVAALSAFDPLHGAAHSRSSAGVAGVRPLPSSAETAAERHSQSSLFHIRNWIAHGAVDDSSLGASFFDVGRPSLQSDSEMDGTGVGGESVPIERESYDAGGGHVGRDSVSVSIHATQEEQNGAGGKASPSPWKKGGPLADFVRLLPHLPKFVTKLKLKPALTITDLPKRTVDYDSQEAEEHVIPFILELGQALQQCCVPAHRLEYELDLISKAFGIQGHFFTVPGVFFSSFGSPTTVLSPFTHLITTGGATWEVEKIRQLENLGEKVAFGHLSCAEGMLKIEDIMAEPPLYGNFVTAVSFAACSCGIAQLFGGSANDLFASTVVGMFVGLLCVLCVFFPRLNPMSDILSGASSAIFAGLCAHLFKTSEFVVTICGIIALVPGLSITVAVAEIASGKLVPGVAHLASALLCVLKLAAGIMLGQAFVQRVWDSSPDYSGHPISDYYYFLTLPLVAWSFMVMLRSRMNEFWSVMIACLLGYVGGSVLGERLGTNLSSFVGAFMVCAFANASTWVWREGVASVPIFTGTLLLVPGSMGVKGVLELGGSLDSDQNYFLQMFLVALFICQGLFAANLVIRPHKAL